MIIEIAFSVCLIAQPASCSIHKLSFMDEHVTGLQCTMGIAGQKQIADWLKGRPNMFLARWKCSAPGRYAKI